MTQEFPKDDMKAIECGTCSTPQRPVIIPLLHQYPVRGVQTFEYHCSGCNGKVWLQLVRNARTGEIVAKQVRLTGSPEEFRPEPIRPGIKLQIPVAYTLGNSKSTRHVEADPLQPPSPAYTLGTNQPQQELPPDHPMHPDQIRRRMQPIRWE